MWRSVSIIDTMHHRRAPHVHFAVVCQQESFWESDVNHWVHDRKTYMHPTWTHNTDTLTPTWTFMHMKPTYIRTRIAVICRQKSLFCKHSTSPPNKVSFSFTSSLVMWSALFITQNCQFDIKCRKRGISELVNENKTLYRKFCLTTNICTCISNRF